MKNCTKCGSSNVSGRSKKFPDYCIKCVRAANEKEGKKRWKKKNPEKHKEKKRLQREKYKEKRKEYQKEYSKKNVDSIRVRHRGWYKKKAQEKLEIKLKYEKDNEKEIKIKKEKLEKERELKAKRYRREYYEKNLKGTLEYKKKRRQYYLDNRDKYRLHNFNRHHGELGKEYMILKDIKNKLKILEE